MTGGWFGYRYDPPLSGHELSERGGRLTPEWRRAHPEGWREARRNAAYLAGAVFLVWVFLRLYAPVP